MTRVWNTRLLEGAEQFYQDSTLTGDLMTSSLDPTVSLLGSQEAVLLSTMAAAKETGTILKAKLKPLKSHKKSQVLTKL